MSESENAVASLILQRFEDLKNTVSNHMDFQTRNITELRHDVKSLGDSINQIKLDFTQKTTELSQKFDNLEKNTEKREIFREQQLNNIEVRVTNSEDEIEMHKSYITEKNAQDSVKKTNWSVVWGIAGPVIAAIVTALIMSKMGIK